MGFRIAKINVSRINNEWLYKGKNGSYLTIAISDNDQPDKFGNTVSISQLPPMEKKDTEKPIPIGDGKSYDRKKQLESRSQQPAPTPSPSEPTGEDHIVF